MSPEGFLNLLKPPGMTSHDVVAMVRRRLGLRRIGHLGTLDPAAAGVLPVALGRATRLFEFAAGPDKVYRAEVVFGITTDTLDGEGEVSAEGDSSALGEDDLAAMTHSFVGEIEQTPPAYSAVSVGGRRLHELAREGVTVKARPRRVEIMSIDVVEFSPGRRARAVLDVVCGGGTYIRALAADLGKAAGCGAYLGFLVRTRVGRFELSQALTLEKLGAGDEEDGAKEALLPVDFPLAHLAAVRLEAEAGGKFLHGGQVLTKAAAGYPVRVYGPDERLLGLGEVLTNGRLRPRVVIASDEDVGR